ncbi:hypothetical protein [Mannheimia bovis]|uniref:Uncharacterized protein n=1 Tax=Mannheimia bovis TaxID=2770636 RepID=A0A7H1C536_9PAST|nr:hypothetical protein [Mannheimia bovis]QNS16091.1 hypothetical protein ICJ55_05030 [Mannheimia bovis]
MSSQNSFLTKYSKSNSHSQDSQKINEALEWLNEKYDELCDSFLIAVGLKEFLDKGFVPPTVDDINKVAGFSVAELYELRLISLKHINNLESSSFLDEEMREILNKYKVFFSIFESEIQEVTHILRNKIVIIGEEDIDNLMKMQAAIDFLNKIDIGDKIEFSYPDIEEGGELFLQLLAVLAILRIYRNRNIFILDGVIFNFFPKFIAILGTGAFNGFLDFPSLVGKVFPEIIDTINEGLDLDIAIEDFEVLSQEEMTECMGLYEQALIKKAEEGEIGLLNVDEINSFYEDNSELILPAKNHVAEYIAPQPDSKASSAILKFFDSNSNTLVAKLKESGLQLSAVALQNDQNIARVANVVYNLLPGMVRIFVSYDTVENFLLNNRQWLINKLV